MRTLLAVSMGCLLAVGCDDEDSAGAPVLPLFQEQVWAPANPLGEPAAELDGLDIAAAPDGSAVAVWVASDGTNADILASFFRPESGWGPSQVVESLPGLSFSPQVAMNQYGEALLVWIQAGGTPRWTLYSTAYRDGVWRGPIAIDRATGGHSGGLALASHAAGHAVAVWVQEDADAVGRVYANRFCGPLGWAQAEQISPSPTAPVILGNYLLQSLTLAQVSYGASPTSGTSGVYGTAELPRVDVTEGGRATAVWLQKVDGQDRVMANDYLPPAPGGISGWGVPQAIDAGTERAFEPDVAIDGQGGAMAVWAQGATFPGSTILAARQVDFEWTPATAVSSGTEVSSRPTVVLDLEGNATALWKQWEGRDVLHARKFAGTWEPEVRIDADGSVSDYQVGMDSGAVWAAFESHDGPAAHVRAARIGGSVRTLDDGSAYVQDVHIAVARGEAFTIWSQEEGALLRVWTRRTAQAWVEHP